MGCKEEWALVCDMVKQGCHLATSIDDYSDNVGHQGHFFSIVVNNNGEVVWQ